MKLSDKQIKNIGSYYNEYLVYNAIEQAYFETDDERFTAKFCKGLRNKVAKECGKTDDLSGVKISQIKSGVSKVMSEIGLDISKLKDGEDVCNKFYADLHKEFCNITGFKAENGKLVYKNDKSNKLPISPYDPRFDIATSLKEGGVKMGLVRCTDLINLYDGDSSKLITDKNKAYSNTVKIEIDEKLSDLYLGSDLIGLSYLKDKMSEVEYANIKTWLSNSGGNFMSNEKYKMAAEILDGISNMGFDYKVMPDTEPGQVKMKLVNYPLEMRLIDKKEHENYIGRIYYDGDVSYFTTNIKETTNGKVTGFKAFNDAKSDDILNMFKFVIGQKVELGGKTLGEHYEYKYGNSSHNSSYVNKNGKVSVAYKDIDKYGGKVRIYTNKAKASDTYFDSNNDVKASTFIYDAISSAKDNYEMQFDMDNLIDTAERINLGEAADFNYSMDESIAFIQRGYMDLLTNDDSYLLKVDNFDKNYLDEYQNLIKEHGKGNVTKEMLLEHDLIYQGDSLDQIESHLKEFIHQKIGQFEADEHGLRFNILNTSRYMKSEFGVSRNREDLINACKALKIDGHELRGEGGTYDFIKNALQRFDFSNSVKMKDLESPFMKNMYNSIYETINTSGCKVNEDDILIDNKGIVHYTAYRYQTQKIGDPVMFYGELGQIFEPNEMGVVKTDFSYSNNYLTVPGYEAYVIPQKMGEDLSMEERTRLKGYEQIMSEVIRSQIRKDVMSSRPKVGSSVNLSKVYTRLYDTRHDLDFFDKAKENGLDDSWVKAIIETERRRVKYPNVLKEGSTINADFTARKNGFDELRNDNFKDAYTLSGHRNLAVLDEHVDGYFDPIMTGGATNQGTVRFLAEGAGVDSDGKMVRSNLDDKTPLMKHDDMKFSHFNPSDRQQMVGSNLLVASAITKPTNMMQICCGGWNMDDGIVVSKKFAEEYQIRGSDGELRNLKIGDKLSDLHGNKGVISMVVDPDMHMEKAKSEKLDDLVKLFKNNKDVDIMMAPFPSVSRFNAGSTKELMQNTMEGFDADGNSLGQVVGQAKFIVTHMAVDVKTKIYDDNALLEGKGRKASGQLAWALASQEAGGIMHEFYGNNKSALVNLRERMIAMGLDIDEDGKFITGYKPHKDEERFEFNLADVTDDKNKNVKGSLDVRRLTQEFGQEIMNKGGFLNLPFNLSNRKIGVDFGNKLPILSSHLRSSHQYDDGMLSAHDYTSYYLDIYKNALKYKELDLKMSDMDSKSSEYKKMQDEKIGYKNNAQNYLDRLHNDMSMRYFEGKHNMIRDGVMASKLGDSSTAIWTADPRLDINEVGISREIANANNIKDGEYIMLWRDPMLRDAGVRGMRAKIDDNIFGISISPIMSKSFDGDFDGGTTCLRMKSA